VSKVCLEGLGLEGGGSGLDGDAVYAASKSSGWDTCDSTRQEQERKAQRRTLLVWYHIAFAAGVESPYQTGEFR
jgi:hypothetical protein